MPRRRMPRPFAPALERAADAWMPPTLLAAVQRVWPAAVGPALATAAEPVAERDGTVTVACGSAVLAQELDLMSERVVANLNERLGRPAVLALRAQARPPRS